MYITKLLFQHLIHSAFFCCNVFYFLFSSSSLLLGTKKGLPVVLITEGRKVSRQKPSQTKLSVGDIVDAKYVILTCTVPDTINLRITRVYN